MSNRVQFRRYDVGYQPTESLATQPPDKGSNVLPTLTTDLSKANQELEEKVSILPKLSGLTLDDFVERLAADVAPVRHGKWIETGYYGYSKNPIFQCSECRKEVEDRFIKNHKFCLHCGAKMDLED